MARAKKEKVQYTPFDFEYFRYGILDFTAYGRVLERTGLDECVAQVFSIAAPFGERGTVQTVMIDSILTAAQFEAARAQGWPATPPG